MRADGDMRQVPRVNRCGLCLLLRAETNGTSPAHRLDIDDTASRLRKDGARHVQIIRASSGAPASLGRRTHASPLFRG
ncbi:hypothetical protein XAP6164_3560002 [Xanthomonas phaseoli pv. phaseoli]|nr:hypothetical protein XAP6164_3560002 [Xanthomonas phaseoli pv. phaseoli]